MAKNRIIPALGIVVLATAFCFGCAGMEKQTKGPPLSDEDTERIAHLIQIQQQRVSSFYALGRISVGEWYGDAEADIFVAGFREPFRIKMEIAHTWGQPLLHILIEGNRVEALAFRENRFYSGTLTSQSLSRLISVHFAPGLVWGILRGYPDMVPHGSVKSLGKNQISLITGKGKVVETIDLYEDRVLPKIATFPGMNIRVIYAAFGEEKGIPYARSVKVAQIDGGKRLTLKHRKMVFNRDIPAEIFSVTKPPAMDTVDLDKVDAETRP